MINTDFIRNSFYTILIIVAIWLSFIAGSIQDINLINTVTYILLAILCLYTIYDSKDFREIFFDKKDLFLWAYLLILTVSSSLALNKIIALNRFRNYAIPILILYYFFKKIGIFLKNRFIKKALFVCVLADIVAFIAILEILFHKNIFYENIFKNIWYRVYLVQGRAMSTQAVPAVLGTYLLACIPFSYYISFNAKKNLLKIFGIASAILCVIGLILTFSRGSFVGLIVLSIFYFYKRNRKFIIYLILTTFFLISIFSFFKSKNVERFSLKGLSSKGIYEYRIARFITTFNILKKRPFIGVGLDNFRPSFNKYSPRARANYYANYLVKIADNMHLTILAESGIFAYLAFIFFVSSLLIRGYSCNSEMCLVLSAGIFGMLFNMLTYDLLYWTVPFYIFWIYCGMLSSLTLKKDI